MTSSKSFEKIEQWLQLYRENYGGDGMVFLVGNKIDLTPREVETNEAL